MIDPCGPWSGCLAIEIEDWFCSRERSGEQNYCRNESYETHIVGSQGKSKRRQC